MDIEIKLLPAVGVIPISELVSCTFSTIPICLFLIQTFMVVYRV